MKYSSNPKPEHTTGGSGRGGGVAGRRGGAGLGRTPTDRFAQETTDSRTPSRSWLLTSGSVPICPRKPFSCKACPGMG